MPFKGQPYSLLLFSLDLTNQTLLQAVSQKVNAIAHNSMSIKDEKICTFTIYHILLPTP